MKEEEGREMSGDWRRWERRKLLTPNISNVAGSVRGGRGVRKKYNGEEGRFNEGKATGRGTEWKYNQSNAEVWKEQTMGATVIMES